MFVIECKIRALLKPKQNPENEVEFWEKGYGCAIERRFELLKCPLHYVVFGYRRPLNLPADKSIVCSQKWWDNFECGYPENGEIAKDLADCLGRLGIHEFRARATKDMKINEPKIAAQSYAVVRDTCITKLNVPADRIELDTDFSRSGRHFGSEILPSNRKSDLSSYLGRLQKLIVPRQGESVCWLGYQKGALKHAERAVWFYCGTASEMKAVRTAFLKKWAAPQDVSFETSQAGSGDPDRKWFLSVFEALPINLI